MTHTVLSNKLLHYLMNQKSSPNGSSKCRIGHSGTLDLLANEGQQPDSSATTLAQHRFNGQHHSTEKEDESPDCLTANSQKCDLHQSMSMAKRTEAILLLFHNGVRLA